MKSLKIFGFAGIILLVVVEAATGQIPNRAPDYDALKDFSIQANPNGVWSYGWESTLGSTLNLYTVTDTTSVPGMSVWLRSGTFPYHPPYVAHNDTDKQVCFATVCDPPTYLDFHPGQNDELSVVRWTAPFDGQFFMQVSFVGLDYVGPTSTYVYVLRNSKQLFLKAPITNYLRPYEWTLSAGGTVDFMVDWGGDRNFYFDSTGVEVKIWNLGQH